MSDTTQHQFEGQGDHIGAIKDIKDFFQHDLKAFLHDSVLKQQALVEASLEDGQRQPCRVAALGNDGAASMLAVLARPCDDVAASYEFMTAYPTLWGRTWEVVIDEVKEWSNALEARVRAHWHDFEFWFFPTDYYCNKALYRPGMRLPISLAALGMNVHQGAQDFAFEGQEAVDWLAKSGRKPDYDAQGNIEPVRFSLGQLVAYLPHDDTVPDEAEFNSPLTEIDTPSILGVPLIKGNIIIHRAEGDEEDEDVTIPLYYRRDMLSDPEDGKTVAGWLWLTGQINIWGDTVTDSYGSKAIKFLHVFDECNQYATAGMTHLLSALPHLSLPRPELKIDSMEVVTQEGNVSRLYASECKRVWHPEKDGAWDDTLEVRDVLNPMSSIGIPSLQDVVLVDAGLDAVTHMGVWESWLMHMSWLWLPLRGGGRDRKRISFLRLQSALQIPWADCSQWANASLLPEIVIDGSRVSVTTCYANKSCGLVRDIYRGRIDGHRVLWDIHTGESCQTLVPPLGEEGNS